MVRCMQSVEGVSMSQQRVRSQLHSDSIRGQAFSAVLRTDSAFYYYFYYSNAILGNCALRDRETRARKH